ncbi:hypothetical protein [Magnetospirillum sp. UT-4]|nr:hypothetical protein [Magnetospirillum sp. UT-4]
MQPFGQQPRNGKIKIGIMLILAAAVAVFEEADRIAGVMRRILWE